MAVDNTAMTTMLINHPVLDSRVIPVPLPVFKKVRLCTQPFLLYPYQASQRWGVFPHLTSSMQLHSCFTDT